MYIQYSSQKKKHSSCVWAKLGFALIRTLNEWKCILPQDLEHCIHYFVVLLVFFCVCACACVVINSCKYITSKKHLVCFLLPSCCLPSGSEQCFFFFFSSPPLFGFDDDLAISEINGWKASLQRHPVASSVVWCCGWLKTVPQRCEGSHHFWNHTLMHVFLYLSTGHCTMAGDRNCGCVLGS